MLNNLLGTVASSVLSSNDGLSKAIKLIQTLLQSQGGIQDLIEKFQKNGLEDLVKSWINTGENLPISTSQLFDIFGKQNLDDAAQEIGIEQQEAPALLSEYLPKIVDKLSPNGQLDLTNLDTNVLLQQGAKAIFSKLFS